MALKKQQEDVNSLSRHLDHVINFTKWATASHSGTALLYCKRLVSDEIRKYESVPIYFNKTVSCTLVIDMHCSRVDCISDPLPNESEL